MVSSLCMTADFIGEKTEQAAFVYSVVTFADKLLNGIVVMIIEELWVLESRLWEHSGNYYVPYSKCKDCKHYYQDVLAYACGATVLAGIAALFTMEVYSFSLDKLKETIKNFRISRSEWITEQISRDSETCDY